MHVYLEERGIRDFVSGRLTVFSNYLSAQYRCNRAYPRGIFYGKVQTKFKPIDLLGEQAPNCGFVLLKDKQVVIMYTNNLAPTLEQPRCDGWII